MGKPVGVGGMSMLSTANYEARKYGVRSAMPGFIARKLYVGGNTQCHICQIFNNLGVQT